VNHKDLGEFNYPPTDQQILDRLGVKNPGIRTAEFRVVEITGHGAIISVREGSLIYAPGSFEIRFTIKV